TVANLGQYDYGPVEELAVLRRYGLPLRPRIVVWMFFEGNDLVDVARYQNGGYRDKSKKAAPPKPRSQWSFLHDALGRIRQRSFLRNVAEAARGAVKPSGLKRAGVVQWKGGSRKVYFRHPGKVYSSRDLI